MTAKYFTFDVRTATGRIRSQTIRTNHGTEEAARELLVTACGCNFSDILECTKVQSVAVKEESQ